METKHTPAPWKAEKTKFIYNGQTKYSVIADDDGFSRRIICETPFTKRYNDHEANARLIAAAPELLEACIGLIGILTPKQYSKQFPNVYRKAQQAIKEATG